MIQKKNKKRYDELKNAKELIEKKIKEKAEEILEQNKIRVNQMKKDDDKEKDNQNNEKGSIKSKKDEKNEKETFDTVLSPQQKKNYLQSKDLIEKYKNLMDELMKEEQLYLDKIEQVKKENKNRSSSESKMNPLKLRNKDMKNRTKSNYKGVNMVVKKVDKNIKESQ